VDIGEHRDPVRHAPTLARRPRGNQLVRRRRNRLWLDVGFRRDVVRLSHYG